MKRFLRSFIVSTRINSRIPTARKVTTQTDQASTYSALGEFFANNPALVVSTFIGGRIAIGSGFAWLKYDVKELKGEIKETNKKIEQTNEKVEQGFSDIRKDISELKVLFFQKQAEDLQQKAEKLEAANKAKPGFWGNSSH